MDKRHLAAIRRGIQTLYDIAWHPNCDISLLDDNSTWSDVLEALNATDVELSDAVRRMGIQRESDLSDMLDFIDRESDDGMFSRDWESERAEWSREV